MQTFDEMSISKKIIRLLVYLEIKMKGHSKQGNFLLDVETKNSIQS